MRCLLIRRGRRCGVAAVEAAMVCPMILFLLTGLWEVGRYVEVQQLLTNAAREGARRASTGATVGNTQSHYSDVQAVVTNYLTSAQINTTGLQVNVYNLTGGGGPTYDPTTANQNDHLRVSAVLPVNNVRWVILDSVTGATTLTGTADWVSMKDTPVQVSVSLPGG